MVTIGKIRRSSENIQMLQNVVDSIGHSCDHLDTDVLCLQSDSCRPFLGLEDAGQRSRLRTEVQSGPLNFQ